MEFDLNKVYPWIKSVGSDGATSYITSYAEQGGEGRRFPISEELPWHVFGEDVGVFYVFDTGEQFTLAQYSMLPEGMTEDELYETACRNLWNDVEFRIQRGNTAANKKARSGKSNTTAAQQRRRSTKINITEGT